MAQAVLSVKGLRYETWLRMSSNSEGSPNADKIDSDDIACDTGARSGRVFGN